MVVLGIGNSLRQDDAAGLELARLLQSRLAAAGIAVLEQEGEVLGVIEQWRCAAAAVLVDAVRSGAPPGTIHRIDASTRPIPAELRGSSSTHAVGVAEAIELARALGRLPARVIFYGLEGARFGAGMGLSQELLAVTPKLAEAVSHEAQALSRGADARPSRACERPRPWHPG